MRVRRAVVHLPLFSRSTHPSPSARFLLRPRTRFPFPAAIPPFLPKKRTASARSRRAGDAGARNLPGLTGSLRGAADVRSDAAVYSSGASSCAAVVVLVNGRESPRVWARRRRVLVLLLVLLLQVLLLLLEVKQLLLLLLLSS